MRSMICHNLLVSKVPPTGSLVKLSVSLFHN